MGFNNSSRAGTSKGFTLIELLVVIAIIALLASIILASLSGAQSKSRDATRVSDINELENALALYATKHQSYPNTLSVLASDGDITSVPVDPITGDQFAYTAYGSGSFCNDYHLGALLENTPPSHPGAAAKPGGSECTGGTYQGTDCLSSTDCLLATNGDFSGTGNVYDALP